MQSATLVTAWALLVNLIPDGTWSLLVVAYSGATMPVGWEVAVVVAPGLVAVIVTCTVEPTSEEARVYEAEVAPGIGWQLAPEGSQSCHW